MSKNVNFELFDDLYSASTLMISKIKKLSEMTCDNEAVAIMIIVDDIIAAGEKNMDEIFEKASTV